MKNKKGFTLIKSIIVIAPQRLSMQQGAYFGL